MLTGYARRENPEETWNLFDGIPNKNVVLLEGNDILVRK